MRERMRAPWGWIGAITAAGFLLRVAVLARSLPVLDRLFVPDDTYYTLSIARSLAKGTGPAADGHTLTSGFQPLQAFLLVPVHWVLDGTDAFVRADMAMLVVADTVTIALVGWLAWRLAGKVGAIAAAAIWACSPVAVSMALGGLETSLAVCFAALLVVAWVHAGDRDTTVWWAVAGAVAGLAVLARVDVALLVVLLAGWQLWRGPRRALVPATIAGAVVVAPWWIYCTVQFGSPVPTSGRVEHTLAPLAPFSARGFAQIAGIVAGGPFTSWHSLRTALDDRPGLGVVVFLLLVAVLAFVAWWWFRSTPGRAAVVSVLPVYAIALMVFYVWFGVGWFFSRYMTPVAMVATLVLGTVVGRAWSAAPGRRRTVVLGVTGALGVVALVSVLFGTTHNLTADEPYASPLDSYTGYRQMALVVNERVPKGARLGAWQSGAVGYFAGEDRPVVNLDGVVNVDAADATEAGTIPEYIRDQGIEWLADIDLRLVGFAVEEAKRLDPEPTVTFLEDLPQFPRFPKYAIAQIGW